MWNRWSTRTSISTFGYISPSGSDEEVNLTITHVGLRRPNLNTALLEVLLRKHCSRHLRSGFDGYRAPPYRIRGIIGNA